MKHRPATPIDIPFLHTLYSDEEAAPYLGFEPTTLSEFATIFAELDAGGALMIVEMRGEPVATYQTRRYRHRLSHVAYIGGLVISREARGRGVAKRVIRDVLASLRASGARRIELMVAADNTRAIALFRRCGFIIEGRLRDYFSRQSTGATHDEYVMAMTPTGAFDASPTQRVSVESAPHYNWGANCDGWRLVQSADLSVIQERMPPGAEETRHAHYISRQFFFVLDGSLSIEMNGATHSLTRHEGLEIPPSIPHQVRNTSNADAHFVVVSQPPGQGDRDQGEMTSLSTRPLVPESPDSLDERT
ncbi:MAG: GNAT family N-acetyltransferase [Phycisphaerales bacterium]|nr:GNAT family N-acetyltransferase [Phycisphaerales bacterium]